MDVLVLGGSGFVGKNIQDHFSETDLSFYCCSKSDGDLRNITAAMDLLSRYRPKFIINCAAHVGSLNYVTKQAADVITDNTAMLLNLYRAVTERCPQSIIINPIANCAYPSISKVFREEEWWDGHLHRSVLSYGAAKRHGWAIAECFAMQHNIKTIHLIVPNMYGPYDSTDPNKAHALNALVYKCLVACRQKKPLIVWGTGVAVREWLFAADFSRILFEIISSNGDILGLSEPTNIAQNFGISVRELVDLIARELPHPIDISWESDKPDGAPRKVMDDSRFRRVFPNFRFTALSDGIRETFSYYQSILDEDSNA